MLIKVHVDYNSQKPAVFGIVYFLYYVDMQGKFKLQRQ